MPNQNFSYAIGSGDVLSGTVETENNLLFDFSQHSKPLYVKQLLKNAVIYPRFRLFLCNTDGTIKEQIPNEDIIGGGSYSENYQNGQRRSLSFTLINNDGKYTPGLNSIWTNTMIALEVGLEDPKNYTTIWFKKGIFIVGNASVSHNNTTKTVALSCNDKFNLFEDSFGSSQLMTARFSLQKS